MKSNPINHVVDPLGNVQSVILGRNALKAAKNRTLSWSKKISVDINISDWGKSNLICTQVGIRKYLKKSKSSE